jgi:hypothetical protein
MDEQPTPPAPEFSFDEEDLAPLPPSQPPSPPPPPETEDKPDDVMIVISDDDDEEEKDQEKPGTEGPTLVIPGADSEFSMATLRLPPLPGTPEFESTEPVPAAASSGKSAPLVHMVTSDQDFDGDQEMEDVTPAKWTFPRPSDMVAFDMAKNEQRHLDDLSKDDKLHARLVEARERYLERQIEENAVDPVRLRKVRPPPAPQELFPGAVLTTERYKKLKEDALTNPSKYRGKSFYYQENEMTQKTGDGGYQTSTLERRQRLGVDSFHEYTTDDPVKDIVSVSQRDGIELVAFNRLNKKMLKGAKKDKIDDFFDILKKPDDYDSRSDPRMEAKPGWSYKVLYKVGKDGDGDTTIWQVSVHKRYRYWLQSRPANEFLGDDAEGNPKGVIWAPLVYNFRQLLSDWTPSAKPYECQVALACKIKPSFDGKQGKLMPDDLTPVFALVISRNMLQAEDLSAVSMNILESHSFVSMTEFAKFFPVAMRWFKFAFPRKLFPKTTDVKLNLTLTVGDIHIGTFLRHGFHITGQAGFIKREKDGTIVKDAKEGTVWLHRLHATMKLERDPLEDGKVDHRGGTMQLPNELFSDADLLRLALSKFKTEDPDALRDGWLVLQEEPVPIRVPGTEDPQPALRASQNATSLLELITANQENLSVLLESFAADPKLTERGRAFLASYLAEGQRHANLQTFLMFRTLDGKWPRGPTLAGYAFLAFGATGFWIYGLETFTHGSDPVFGRRCINLLLRYCLETHKAALRMLPGLKVKSDHVELREGDPERPRREYGRLVPANAEPTFRFVQDVATLFSILPKQYTDKPPFVNFLVRRRDKFLVSTLQRFGFTGTAEKRFESTEPYVQGLAELTPKEFADVIVLHRDVTEPIDSKWVPLLQSLQRINPTLTSAAAKADRAGVYMDTVAAVVTFA